MASKSQNLQIHDRQVSPLCVRPELHQHPISIHIQSSIQNCPLESFISGNVPYRHKTTRCAASDLTESQLNCKRSSGCDWRRFKVKKHSSLQWCVCGMFYCHKVVRSGTAREEIRYILLTLEGRLTDF